MTERYAAVIRHVGIARTVLDRFEELARGPSTAQQIGSVLGRIGTDDFDRDPGRQLRIGEASQIFPEVWTNLDAAARALDALAEPCSAYAHLRAGQDAYPLAFRPGSTELDLQSAHAARAAIQAIEAATPAIDWAGIARADAALAADAYRQLGGRSHKVVGILGAAITIVVLIGYFAIRLIGHP